MHLNSPPNPEAESYLNIEAFNLPVAWAHDPLSERLDALPKTLPVFVIYGKDTWMNYNAMRELIRGKLREHQLQMLIIPEVRTYLDWKELEQGSFYSPYWVQRLLLGGLMGRS